MESQNCISLGHSTWVTAYSDAMCKHAKGCFLPAAMYTDASMQHMAKSYTLHAVLHFRSMATQYAYCYVRNPVACPVMSAQAFFVTASIALGERGLTLHERNFAIPLWIPFTNILLWTLTKTIHKKEIKSSYELSNLYVITLQNTLPNTLVNILPNSMRTTLSNIPYTWERVEHVTLQSLPECIPVSQSYVFHSGR